MKTGYVVRRDDGTFVGNGGANGNLDKAYLYAKPPELSTSNFYVRPDLVDSLKKWEVLEVEQVRRIKTS